MKVLEIKPNDFANFHDPWGHSSLFVGMGWCDWKCCKEAGVDVSICQNYELQNSGFSKNIPARDLLSRYLGESTSVVLGGLEPLNDMEGVLELASEFAELAEGWPRDVRAAFVVYTGYTREECHGKIDAVARSLGWRPTLIVKYGRFVPNGNGRFDPVLGVTLASDNQYASVEKGGTPKWDARWDEDCTPQLEKGVGDVILPCEEGQGGRSEAVDHPAHYKSGGIEAIDVIRAFNLGFSLGNAVKYILRAGRKDSSKEIEDLKKAAWYIDEEIKWRSRNGSVKET